MLNQTAEESFRHGLRFLREGKGLQALAFFEAAIELERRQGTKKIQARYLSYYGLCLTHEANRHREGINFCREAVYQEAFDADLYFNLTRACIAAGRRREAYRALKEGLRVDAEHKGLVRELEWMGQRRRPIIPFLDRSHPINVSLGRLFRTAPPHNQGRRPPRSRARVSAAG